ncbi:unnamed protein product [Miscanthus lutarioriparius]|uniref:Uncharacterized protein n=1 Tax=Miscanthus lutarioriparius TaxID=422564 RepID=A0A811MW91_9POAL|nr:unnamed protein product [Miscanthus lutarioriparius]
MLRLHYCRQDHNDVACTVPECRALVQEYNPRCAGGRHGQRQPDSSEYLECAGRLLHAADDCWVHMLYQVVEVASRANLAKAMVEQMVGVADDDDH